MKSSICLAWQAAAIACVLHPGWLADARRASVESPGLVRHLVNGCPTFTFHPATSTVARDNGPDAVSATTEQELRVKNRASGEFDVKITPQPPDDYADGKTLGRSSIDKTFHGDLVGTSKGQMLTALTDVKGSAGYVAIEKVTGTLGGRRGTFVLQHSGTMARGKQQLSLSVVPDSGTDELAGLAGEMKIQVVEGKHSYTFEYTLAQKDEL